MAAHAPTPPAHTHAPAQAAPARWVPWALAVFLTLLYLLNKNPFAGWNDALGFLADAAEGWSPYTNATSHFLYTNTLHALGEVLPFLSLVTIGTWLSVVCGLLCLWRLYHLLKDLTGDAVLAAVPTAMLGLAFSYWQQAEGIEVYAFNNLIAVHYIAWAVADLRAGTRGRAIWVALFLGLGLLTHIQHILSLPFFVAYLATGSATPLRRLGAGLLTAVLFFVLFLPPLLWETNSVAAIFFDNRFQDDVTRLDLLQLLKGIAKGAGYLAYNFHVGLLLIGYGCWHMYRTERRLLGWLALLALPYLGFAAKYSVNDNHVFFLLPYLVLMVPAAYGALACAGWIRRRAAWLLPAQWLLPVLLYGGITLLAPQVPALAAYDHEKAYKGGVRHLLWPGKSMAKDPLAEARRILFIGGSGMPVPEWNYPDGLRYLVATDGLLSGSIHP